MTNKNKENNLKENLGVLVLPKCGSRLCGVVNIAFMQGTMVARYFTEPLVELELNDEAYKVSTKQNDTFNSKQTIKTCLEYACQTEKQYLIVLYKRLTDALPFQNLCGFWL